jgi:hypothetical protein
MFEEEEEVEVERPSRHALAADALLSELLTKVGGQLMGRLLIDSLCLLPTQFNTLSCVVGLVGG